MKRKEWSQLSDKRVKDYDYLFLSTMLRAREAKMLNRERIRRMVDAPSFSEAAKQLTECGFEDMSGMDARQIEETLSKYRAEIFEELERVMPEPAILDAFRLKYDYHNAKVLVKAGSADVDGAYLMSESGRVPAQQLIDAYNNEDFRFTPKRLGEAIVEASSIIRRTDNPQLADFALDKAYYAELLELAEGLSSPFLLEYIKLMIDGANLNAIVRTIRLERDFEFIKSALIPGGSRDAEHIAKAALSGEALAPMYSGTAYEKAAELGDEAARGGRLTEFELCCEKVESSFFDKAKYASFGAEAVIAYFGALESEITAARMILTCKLAGVSPELVRERLCD